MKRLLVTLLSVALLLTPWTAVHAAPPGGSGHTLTVDKVVENAVEDRTEFQVQVYRDGQLVAQGVMQQGFPVTFTGLSNGKYTLEEEAVEGYELVSIQPSSVAMRGRNNSYSMTVTNRLSDAEPPPTDPPPPETDGLHYVALGDSLVTGSTSRGTTTSYIHEFFQHLKAIHPQSTVTMTSLAQNGDASTELLDNLTSNAHFQDEVRRADVITVSIGGNNILGAGKDGFSRIDHDEAEAGTQTFEHEYPLIITAIRQLNPQARILVMTLYNPYNTVKTRGYDECPRLHAEVEEYVGRINVTISQILDTAYTIVDVHNYFLVNYANKGKMGDVTYFYPASLLRFIRDPHPNQKGQDEMALLHKQAYPPS